jgi:hypothetical protein
MFKASLELKATRKPYNTELYSVVTDIISSATLLLFPFYHTRPAMLFVIYHFLAALANPLLVR